MNDVRITGDTGQDSRKPLLRRRPMLGVAVAVAAAAAVTATLVVTDGIGDRQASSASTTPDASGSREVSAAKVLHAAADRVREEEEDAEIDVPRDDQFIYTEEIVKETDRKTGKTDVRTAENWASVDRSKRGWVDEIGRKGSWSEPLGGDESTFPPPGWDALKKLPTDPAELIRYLAAGPTGTGKKPESLKKIKKQEWYMIQFSLRGLATGPVAPEGLRPAALDGLAMVPGMKAESGVEDGEGRPTMGVAYDHKFTRQQMILFDEDTHEYRGDRDIRTTLDNKKSYDQFIRLTDYAVVDKVKQRP